MGSGTKLAVMATAILLASSCVAGVAPSSILHRCELLMPTRAASEVCRMPSALRRTRMVSPLVFRAMAERYPTPSNWRKRLSRTGPDEIWRKSYKLFPQQVSTLRWMALYGDDACMVADRALGTRIKKRRQVLGMTQQQLADAVGVSKSTVANWESGKHFPLRYLGKLEAVLGVTLGGDGDAGIRPLDEHTRAAIIAHLPGDLKTQRRVIGIMEGTLTWPGEDETGESSSG